MYIFFIQSKTEQLFFCETTNFTRYLHKIIFLWNVIMYHIKTINWVFLKLFQVRRLRKYVSVKRTDRDPRSGFDCFVDIVAGKIVKMKTDNYLLRAKYWLTILKYSTYFKVLSTKLFKIIFKLIAVRYLM